MNTCPNCGVKAPRTPDAVLCQNCFDACPGGAIGALRAEATFRRLMDGGVKFMSRLRSPHEHPYGKNFK